MLEIRIDFQNHVVLVQLREDGRDLPLTEGVVQRLVDACGRMPSREALSRSMTKSALQSLVLLVGSYVAQLGEGLELLYQPGRPLGEFIRHRCLRWSTDIACGSRDPRY